MGESHSNTLNCKDSYFRTHYQPITKNILIPGTPTYLKFEVQHQTIQNQSRQTPNNTLIDLYNVILGSNYQQLDQIAKIYEKRKCRQPWIVQVLHYELEDNYCSCAQGSCRVNVYTEHVETRLSNFFIANPNTKKRQIDTAAFDLLQSFSLDEGIYVLISSLHGYQMLAEQYRLNYPTPYSIGINRKGQVKMWINQNWAINQQNQRIIPIHLIIEQVIQLIQERTNGPLAELLKVNNQLWNFEDIQQRLGEYTINYHRGRKTLQQKIDKRYNENGQSRGPVDKFSAKKTKQQFQEIPLNSIVFPPQNDLKAANQQRRYNSLNIRKTKNNNIQQSYKSYSIRKSQANPRITVCDSPKKQVRFTYQQTQATSRPTSLRTETPTNNHSNSFFRNSQTNQVYNSYLSTENNLLQVKKNSSPTFQRIDTSKQTISLSNQFDILRFQQNNLNKHLNAQISFDSCYRKKALPKNFGKEAFTSESFNQWQQRLPNKLQNQTTNDYSFNNTSNFLFSNEEFRIEPLSQSFSREDDKTQLKQDSEAKSLSQMTEQFKMLLQSQNIIDDYEDQPYNQYSSLLKTIVESRSINLIPQQQDQYVDDQKIISMRPLQSQFYPIKEVDQDRSYSIDQNR